jgi:alanine racemase
MPISRRGLLAGAAIGGALLAGRPSAAAPPLTPQPRGTGVRSATRGNAWLEVDAAQFEANLRELRRQVGELRSVCLVVKADAYGHGLDLLMPSIRRHGITWLGITSNEEARVVRAHGFRGRILRLRVATADEVEDGLQYRIEEMVGGLEVATNAARIAARRGSRLPMHVALNSMGMSREGLDLRLERNREEARKLLALTQLRLAGVMDHCPVNTVEEHRDGARRFKDDATWLLRAAGVGRNEVLLHCANSFASLNVPENRLDLMRVGRAVYGHGGNGFPEFRFFSTFKARVASVGSFPAGATVSYERAQTLRRESRLANIPVGYSDGYRRVFSGTDRLAAAGARQPQVLIQGKRVPVVGLVTMNVLVADVTDLPGAVRAGDEVVLYGRQGEESIGIEELMGIAGTNPPDLYTLWGNSLPKIRI